LERLSPPMERLSTMERLPTLCRLGDLGLLRISDPVTMELEAIGGRGYIVEMLIIQGGKILMRMRKSGLSLKLAISNYVPSRSWRDHFQELSVVNS